MLFNSFTHSGFTHFSLLHLIRINKNIIPTGCCKLDINGNKGRGMLLHKFRLPSLMCCEAWHVFICVLSHSHSGQVSNLICSCSHLESVCFIQLWFSCSFTTTEFINDFVCVDDVA